MNSHHALSFSDGAKAPMFNSFCSVDSAPKRHQSQHNENADDVELKTLYDIPQTAVIADRPQFSRTPGPGPKRGDSDDLMAWNDPTEDTSLRFMLFDAAKPNLLQSPPAKSSLLQSFALNDAVASGSPDLASMLKFMSTPSEEGSASRLPDEADDAVRGMERLITSPWAAKDITAPMLLRAPGLPPSSSHRAGQRADRYETSRSDERDADPKPRDATMDSARYLPASSQVTPQLPLRHVASDVLMRPKSSACDASVGSTSQARKLQNQQLQRPFSKSAPTGLPDGARWDSLRTSQSFTSDRSVASSTDSSSALHLQFLANSAAKAAPELVESPRSKAAFKDFSQEFRSRWKQSPAEAEAFAREAVKTMPEHAQWRVYVDLAELAKKLDDADKAREYYILACEREHRASMIWLEWSKMEEENDRPDDALAVLAAGLSLCRMSESLLPRIVKLLERLRRFDSIRQILSSLKYDTLDHAWKLLMEGCLFEARDGRSDVARSIFTFLMTHVHWHGPIYYEAFRLEEREGRETRAKAIANKGLVELKHYGPLWFGLMRLLERQDIRAERRLWLRGQTPKLDHLSVQSRVAAMQISKELTWRVYFERFQAEERAAEIAAIGLYNSSSGRSLRSCRAAMLGKSRNSLALSLLLCPSSPNNLRWRLFLVGARLELGVGNIKVARSLLKRAYAEVPAKSKARVIIECSRLEEFLGRIDVARQILLQSRSEMNHDWKGYLERVLLEARVGDFHSAIEAAEEAVQAHPGAGRLWALCIQLYHRMERIDLSVFGYARPRTVGLSPKENTIRRAIAQVPKSGEVWCEYARCLLNPFQMRTFDMGQAMRALNFAINFTPQCGDSFVEYLRLELLYSCVLETLCEELGLDPIRFAKAFLSDDEDSDLANHANCPVEKRRRAAAGDERELEVKMRAMHNLQFDFVIEPLVEPRKLDRLERRCVNADPNYGSAWFHCRTLPHDIPTTALENAKELLRHELLGCQRIYGRALLHYTQRCLAQRRSQLPGGTLLEAEEAFLSAYSKSMRAEADEPHPVVLVDRSTWFCSSDFITGLIDMNRSMFDPHVSAEVRRRHLCDTDQIIN